jgi:hypothetical protein
MNKLIRTEENRISGVVSIKAAKESVKTSNRLVAEQIMGEQAS